MYISMYTFLVKYTKKDKVNHIYLIYSNTK